jgi:hypothetical protein
MKMTCLCTCRPAAAARAGFRGTGSLALVLLLAAPALLSAADEPAVLRGAKASAPVKPEIINVDLRNLPLAAEWQPGDGIKEIPRRHTHPPRFDDPLGLAAEPQEDPLLALQEAVPIVMDAPSPTVSFAGQGFTGVNPPDTVGDVSPSHFIQAINHSSGTSITIYNKTGGIVAGPTILDTLGAGGNCASGLGDPVVLYDHLADRWLLSEFSSAGNALCVYISQTNNPVAGGWFRYAFTAPTFPDYPKYGVWPDAYYVGTNESSPTVYAFDRNRMLAGLSATMQRFTAPDLPGFGFQIVTPADLDGPTPPPAGAPGIFMRHRDDESHPPASAGQDFLQLFEFHVDWTAPANSTFTGPVNIAVSEFDSNLCGLTSFSCVPQPSGANALDPLREVVMFRLQYRNFSSHQTLVGNLVTDVNGTDRHGIRWFELRKTGANWALQQEGTFSPDATHRWMGSASMDSAGNIMVGYNVSSSSVFPGLRYAGRLAGDPAGTLAQGETVLRNGTASNASNRWGDYAAMTVDPGDNCTFWFTGQYSPATSWGTWIGAVKFPNCGTPTPDFSLACAPSTLSIQQGASGGSTCTVSSTGGFASAVSLACAGLPAGASCGFSPNPATPPANGNTPSALTVSVAGSVAAGSYPFQAQGTSGGNTRTVNMTLNVTSAPVPDFSIACSPASLSVQQGSSGTSTCTVSSTGGFASAVNLDCASLPAGVTCGYNPPSVTPPANGSVGSTLTVSVGGSVAAGGYSFQARGISGATARTFNMSLTVTGTGGGDLTAVFDPTLRAPKCGTVGRSCDSGAALLLGRNGLGPEPNQPNTINNSCADGTSGTFHLDESNDRIKVSTVDGTNFAPGKTVRIEATVWAWTTPAQDKLDLYFAADANSPTWTFVTTLTPPVVGAQTLSATYTLPSGALQAVRAQFRFQGSASPCTAGGFNDRDDLIFAVTSTPVVTVFEDNFTGNLGWAANPNGTDTATTGAWERGDPEPTNSGGAKQIEALSAANDLVTGRVAGASAGEQDIDGGTTSIQSPAITLPSTGTLTLSFQYYLAHGSNATSADFFRASVVVGSTPTQVFQSLGAAVNRNGAWTPVSVNLASFAGQTIRLRFEAADAATASLIEAGVDDVRITQQ